MRKGICCLLVVMAVIFIGGCRGNSKGTKTGTQDAVEKESTGADAGGPDVYLAGSCYTGAGVQTAIIWKNGQTLRLADGRKATEANAVFVEGVNRYAVGAASFGSSEEDMYSQAMIWKDAALTFLTEHKAGSRGSANDVYVFGDTVYVCGSEMNERGFLVASVWKNGQVTRLAAGGSESNANSIFVSKGGHVFVCGYQTDAEGKMEATLWRDGIAQVLKAGDGASNALSVYVLEQDVYVAGFRINETDQHVATLWKNAEVLTLSNGLHDAMLFSVYVSPKGEVYSAGYEMNLDGYETATLWKGTEATRVADGTRQSYARAVAGMDNDLYIVINETDSNGNSVSKLWKNAQVTQIAASQRNPTFSDIFLSKR